MTFNNKALLSLGVLLFLGCASTPMKQLMPSEFITLKKSKYETLNSPDSLQGWEKGLWFYKHEKYEEAIPLLESHKDKNIAEVEHAYGYMIERFKRDYKEASQWYKKAITHANLPNSKHNLANLYNNGAGVKQDEDKALELYKESAKQGYHYAQYTLALNYCKGSGGVSEDFGKAYYWFQQSYHNGNSYAANKIGHMYENGYHGFKTNHQKALEWYTLSAQMGNPKAQENVVRIKMLIQQKKTGKSGSIIIRG